MTLEHHLLFVADCNSNVNITHRIYGSARSILIIIFVIMKEPDFNENVRKGHGGLYKARAKEESERLRGDGDQTKYIDLRFERWQVVRFGKTRMSQPY